MNGEEGPEHWNERGRALHAAGRTAEAEAAYRKAAMLATQWSAPLYNLGLMYKELGRWEESLKANLEAAERCEDDQATWWNVGIAATALADWRTARHAWSRAGLPIAPGDDEPRADFGLIPVRLDPAGRSEVVWATRIDPARAILENVPLPDSGFGWGDTVLHDGAPNGYRTLNGRDVPVFDGLARLERGRFVTFSVDLGEVGCSGAALLDAADALGGAGEDWGASVRVLCRACSEGRPSSAAHTHASAEAAVGIAARDAAHFEEILRRARAFDAGARG